VHTPTLPGISWTLEKVLTFVYWGSPASQTLRNSRPPASLIYIGFPIQINEFVRLAADHLGVSGGRSPPVEIRFDLLVRASKIYLVHVHTPVLTRPEPVEILSSARKVYFPAGTRPEQ
jgi:hypothetical protein